MTNLNLVKEFSFGNGVSIQGLILNDVPVFAAFEVARILGYSNPHDAVYSHCKRLIKLDSRCERDVEIIGFSKATGITLIKESDLYRLIMRSTLPEAENFQDWVCEEVLPSIRKHGKYEIAPKAIQPKAIQPKPETTIPQDTLLELEMLKQEIQTLKEAAQPKPKAPPRYTRVSPVYVVDEDSGLEVIEWRHFSAHDVPEPIHQIYANLVSAIAGVKAGVRALKVAGGTLIEIPEIVHGKTGTFTKLRRVVSELW